MRKENSKFSNNMPEKKNHDNKKTGAGANTVKKIWFAMNKCIFY